MTATYKMTVDLNVLDHLGINLYSNIAAVITEAVANAWDADAEHVSICVDPESQWIEIQDDGIGMTVSDMNEKYLRVGYRRRDFGGPFGKVTAKGRHVMGRKGLGKLSLFSIASTIEVQSAKEGGTHGMRMTVEGIHGSVQRHEAHYTPDPLTPESLKIQQGTLIRLEQIKRQRLGPGVNALRKRLARRFSVIHPSQNFEVTIDGTAISPHDRGDLEVAQFLWHFGTEEPDNRSTRSLIEKEALPNRLEDWEAGWMVKGWIGTAALPKQLDDEAAGNLNGIVVFSRGRLFHENVLDRLNDGRIYTKYLTGQIEADFLDDDAQPDIATSDRQRVQEDDPRYIQLVLFLKKQLTHVERRWTEWRKKHEVEKVKKTNPAVSEWLDSLPEGFRKSAETLVSNLGALPIENDDDRKLIYKHGILAFERMKLRGSAEEFSGNVGSVDKLLELLAGRDALEASLYRDIVKSRLEAIDDFQKVVDQDEKEKVLQKYLFEHLWLLDPAWERATESPLMETRLLEEGVVVEDLTEKERLGRVDIKYRTIAGRHMIIELKKAGRKMELMELQAQGLKYVDKLTKILTAQNVPKPDIEVVFVLGTLVDEETSNPERLKKAMAVISEGSRVIHYDTLIHGAKEAYAAYLEKSKELDKLDKIIARL
jgi:hypothetical protein